MSARAAAASAVALAAALVTLGACGSPSAPVPVRAAESPAAPAPSNSTAGRLLALQLPGMDRVEVQTVAYRSVGSERLEMDLYRSPTSGASATPVVVVLHGVSNDADPKSFGALVGWGQAIAANGMTAAVINYRPDDDLHSDVGNEDVRTAVTVLRKNAQLFRIDPDRLGFLGFSAGGPFMVAGAFDPRNAPVRAAAGLYPLLGEGVPGSDPEFSLVDAARRDPDLPVLLGVGAKDMVPGIADGVARVETSEPSRRNQIRMVVHEDAGHGFDFRDHDERSRAIITETLTFLAEALA